MKQFLVRGSAAVLVAAAALSTACSNDPTSPSTLSPRSARSNYVGGAVVGARVDTSGASTSSGYLISYGRDGQQ